MALWLAWGYFVATRDPDRNALTRYLTWSVTRAWTSGSPWLSPESKLLLMSVVMLVVVGLALAAWVQVL